MSFKMLLQFLSAPPLMVGGQDERIAYKATAGEGPDLIWCGGLRSDMEGEKATCLHAWAQVQNRACIRFDYYGHGQSSGEFERGTISRWSRDLLQIIDEQAQTEVILVASSMGGWVALKAALARPDRVKALLLIAPAPDFTARLMWPQFDEAVRAEIIHKGVTYLPSEYGEPMPVSRALIEDGANNLLMEGPIMLNKPVRILQGMQDPDVPYAHALALMECLHGTDVHLTLVKSGDHRLSEPEDIARLMRAVDDLCQNL